MIIRRVAENLDGIQGVLIYTDENEHEVAFALTLENPEFVIATGEYDCVLSWYHRGGYETYEIIVNGRTRILFHKGVIEDHSLGCVLIGEQFEELGEKWKNKDGILGSTKGFDEFMQRTGRVPKFKLKVEVCYK